MASVQRYGLVLVLAAVCCALQIVFVGKLDSQETPVGIVIGSLIGYVVAASQRLSGERYRMKAVWLLMVPRVLFNVARDSVRLFVLLIRRCAGGPLPGDRIVELPFEAGSNSPESRMRRALAIAAVSAAPNSIVLRLNRSRGIMRVHLLDADVPRPASAEWPV